MEGTECVLVIFREATLWAGTQAVVRFEGLDPAKYIVSNMAWTQSDDASPVWRCTMGIQVLRGMVKSKGLRGRESVILPL
jgi:hypothetical protein